MGDWIWVIGERLKAKGERRGNAAKLLTLPINYNLFFETRIRHFVPLKIKDNFFFFSKGVLYTR